MLQKYLVRFNVSYLATSILSATAATLFGKFISSFLDPPSFGTTHSAGFFLPAFFRRVFPAPRLCRLLHVDVVGREVRGFAVEDTAVRKDQPLRRHLQPLRYGRSHQVAGTLRRLDRRIAHHQRDA